MSFPRSDSVCDRLLSLFPRHWFLVLFVAVRYVGLRRPRPRLLVLVGACVSCTLYLSTRVAVCLVVSSGNGHVATRAARRCPPPPFVSFLYFICVALASAHSCETNFASRLFVRCVETCSSINTKELSAASLRVHARREVAANLLLPLGLPVYSFMVALSSHLSLKCATFLFEQVSQPIARSLSSILDPCVAVAAATKSCICHTAPTTL